MTELDFSMRILEIIMNSMTLTVLCHLLSDFPMDSSNGNCRGVSSGEYTAIFLVFTCGQTSLDVT